MTAGASGFVRFKDVNSEDVTRSAVHTTFAYCVSSRVAGPGISVQNARKQLGGRLTYET